VDEKNMSSFHQGQTKRERKKRQAMREWGHRSMLGNRKGEEDEDEEEWEQEEAASGRTRRAEKEGGLAIRPLFKMYVAYGWPKLLSISAGSSKDNIVHLFVLQD
jgi:hypothetical protein